MGGKEKWKSIVDAAHDDQHYLWEWYAAQIIELLNEIRVQVTALNKKERR